MTFKQKLAAELALLKDYGYKRAGVIFGVGLLFGLIL